jgi:chorismate mutase
MPVRGIRGATIAAGNTVEDIISASYELLQTIVDANALQPADVASIFFTTTPDLTAIQPARAVRDLGWDDTAILCAIEMDASDALPRCVRVLIHWNTDKTIEEVHHVYLHEAARLRPDRAYPGVRKTPQTTGEG